jgi:hypothetical protein
LVVKQVFAEVHEGNYDMIVTGTSQARGIVRHYIMGDLTRSILNRADFPVLVARSGPLGGSPNIFQSLKNWFAIGRAKVVGGASVSLAFCRFRKRDAYATR